MGSETLKTAMCNHLQITNRQDERRQNTAKRNGWQSTMVSGFIRLPVLLPPAIADVAEDEKRHGGQVKNAPVKRFGGAFAHLLRRAGADGALRPDGGNMQGKKKHQYE